MTPTTSSILLYDSTQSLLILYLSYLSPLKRPQDCKQKSTKLVASHSQQEKSETQNKTKETKYPGLPQFDPPRGPASEHWLRNWCLICNHLEHWKNNCPQRLVTSFHTDSNDPLSTLEGKSCMGLSQS